MLEGRNTPATLEMFGPIAAELSPQTNRQLTRLMLGFSGRGRNRLYLAAQKGVEWSEEEAETVNQGILEYIKHKHGLPDNSDPQEFYMQQQRHALGVPKYFSTLLPELKGKIEMKDEIALLSDSPSDLVSLLLTPTNQMDPILAYEVRRHMLFSIIAGEISARTRLGRLRTVLSGVHKQLNARLFEGPVGAGININIDSIHDDETNEVIGFVEDNSRVPVTAHRKRIPLLVRSIPDIGQVYTSPRKKDDENAIIKSLAKAEENNGVIDVSSVQDGIGMMFVAMNDEVDLSELADRVVSIVGSGLRRVVSVTSDDQVGDDHGQSTNIQFLRRQIQFEGVSLPLELIFYDRTNYLNSELEVGSRDSQTGLFRGRSHELYEMRRSLRVLPVIFPREYYDDFQSYAVRGMRRKAEELRGRYRVG